MIADVLTYLRSFFSRQPVHAYGQLSDERAALSPLENIIISCEDLGSSSTTSLESLSATQPVDATDYFIGAMPLLHESEDRIRAYFRSLPDSAFPPARPMLPKVGGRRGEDAGRQHAVDLILDLDETLVHSTNNDGIPGWDFRVEVMLNGLACLYYVHKRPHLEYFIDVVSNWYNLVIFTASLEQYADQVISRVDRGRRLFGRRYFRQHCVERGGLFMKDLTIVNRNLGRVALLDNSLASFVVHPDNAIPIDSWLLDPADTALLELLPFLDALRFTQDVRSVLSLRRLPKAM